MANTPDGEGTKGGKQGARASLTLKAPPGGDTRGDGAGGARSLTGNAAISLTPNSSVPAPEGTAALSINPGGGPDVGNGAALSIDPKAGPATRGGGAALSIGPADGAAPVPSPQGPPASGFGQQAARGAVFHLTALTREQAEQFAAGTYSELELLGLSLEEAEARIPVREDVLARLATRKEYNRAQLDQDLDVRQFLGAAAFIERMARLEEAVRDNKDPAGWLLAQHREAFRRKQMGALWPLVEEFCKDGELDWGEYTRLMARALELGLSTADVDELIVSYARVLEAEGRELKVDREPDIRWPSFMKFKEEGPIRSLEQFRDALLKNRKAAAELLKMDQISEWFQQVLFDVEDGIQELLKSARLPAEDAKGVDVYLNKIRAALKAAQRAERSPGEERAVWRLLWDLGYEAIHLGNKRLYSVEEILPYCDGEGTKLKGVLGSGQLADWCEVVARDQGLSQAAARLKGQAATTGPRDWLWAAGEDRFQLMAQLTYTSPADLARDLREARRHSEALEKALQDGSLKTWVSALVARDKATPEHLEAIEASHRLTGTRRAWAVGFSWGLEKLPLFDSAGARIREINGKGAVLRARKEQPRELISAIRSGAFFAWVDHAVPNIDDLEAQILKIYTLPEAVLPHAACWILGEPTLFAGKKDLRGLDDAIDLFEQDPAQFGLLYRSGEIPTWFWMALDFKQEDVEKAMEVAGGFTEQDEWSVFLWGHGYNGLRLTSSTIVSTPEELLAVADQHLERIKELLDPKLIHLWLGAWPERHNELNQLLLNLEAEDPVVAKEHRVENFLVALGAKPPKLVVEPPTLTFPNLEEGQLRPFDLDVSTAGDRGYLYGVLNLEHPLLEAKDEDLTFVQQHGATPQRFSLALRTPLGKRLVDERMDVTVVARGLMRGRATVPVMVSTIFPLLGIIKTFAGLTALIMGLVIGLRLLSSLLFAETAWGLFYEDGPLVEGAVLDVSSAPVVYIVAPLLIAGLIILHLARPWVPSSPAEPSRLQQLTKAADGPGAKAGVFGLILLAGLILWLVFTAAIKDFYSLETGNASYVAFGDAYASGLTRMLFGEATSGLATGTSWFLLALSLGIIYAGWETFNKYNRRPMALAVSVLGLIMLVGFSAVGTSLRNYGQLTSSLGSQSQEELKANFTDPVLGKRARTMYYTRGLKAAVEEGKACKDVPEMIKNGGALPSPFKGPWDAQGACAYKAKDPDLMSKAYINLVKALDKNPGAMPSEKVIKSYNVITENFKASRFTKEAGAWELMLARRLDPHTDDFSVIDHYFFAGENLLSGDRASAKLAFLRFLELVQDHKRLSKSARVQYYLKLGGLLTRNWPDLAKEAFKRALKLDSANVMKSQAFRDYLDYRNASR